MQARWPRCSAPGSIKVQSSLNGSARVSGPLKTPAKLSGTAEVNNFDVKLQGLELKSAGPLRASLSNGLVTLDQLHITGAGHGPAGERNGAGVRGDRSERRQTGREGQRKREHGDGAHARSGYPVQRQGGVHDCGGRAGGQAFVDRQGADRQCECGDGRRSERAERDEWDAGLQRRPAAGGEPDRDDRRRADQDRRIPDLPERRVCRPDGHAEMWCGCGCMG